MSDPRPTVGPYTETVYDALPDVYRDADADQADGPNNYPLLRYLSTILDQLTPLETYADRFTYTPLDDRDLEDGPSNGFGIPNPPQRYGDGTYGEGTYGDADRSDLVDPLASDAAWLPWLAQVLGVDITGLSIPDQRLRMLNPTEAWAHGTPSAIARLVRAALVNGGYVDVQPHYQGDPFTMVIITKEAETVGATTWGELEQITGGTWAGLEALGSFGNAEFADVILAALPERPAGFAYAHAYLDELPS